LIAVRTSSRITSPVHSSTRKNWSSRPYIFLRLQGHEDELAVLCRVYDPTKFDIFDGETLDILHEALHKSLLYL
jgi:hypothetical protein